MNITKVSWVEVHGLSRKPNTAYFKSRETASRFIEGLAQEREIEDVKIEGGLTMADVKAE